jgi:hypothetical protein
MIFSLLLSYYSKYFRKRDTLLYYIYIKLEKVISQFSDL